MLRYITVFALLAVSVSSFVRADEPQRYVSGDRQVVLVELFTSEGCSSCPPADRWLSSLKDKPGLWSRVVPVAFHVDYWDYIGWQDRFAQSAFGNRHRQYAREGGVSTVYTPGMFKDGREWRDWRSDRSVGSDQKDVGILAIELIDDEIIGTFQPNHSDQANLKLHVALLGMNLKSRVNAGENKGKMLVNDFVVLRLVSTKLKRENSHYSGRLRWRAPKQELAEKAVVAWVSDTDSQAPIQATGGLIN